MRSSPKRTLSVAVIVTCAVAIILLVVFIGYRIRRLHLTVPTLYCVVPMSCRGTATGFPPCHSTGKPK